MDNEKSIEELQNEIDSITSKLESEDLDTSEKAAMYDRIEQLKTIIAQIKVRDWLKGI